MGFIDEPNRKVRAMKKRKEYLTVAEFAAAAGVSKQYIYKQLNQKSTKLNNYCSTIGNKKMIEKSALSDIFGVEDFNQVEQQLNNNLDGAAYDDTLLQSLIEQLAEKDRQLKEKDKQIEQLLKLHDQQQQLTLQSQNLLAASPSSKEDDKFDGELTEEERAEAEAFFQKVNEAAQKKEKELEELRAFKREHGQKRKIFTKFFK